MNSLSLEYITIEPQGKANACVIWLHGLGADGHDFAPIVPQLGLSADHGIRFIFPHAPVRPVTLNAGMPMRAWFDIADLSLDAKMDEQGIGEMVVALNQLVDGQVEQGIAANKIIVAGFSQGGALAIHTGIHYKDTLAGIIGLSTFYPILERLAKDTLQTLPMFMAHGDSDPIVPYDFGHLAFQEFKALDYPIEWHSYAMAHQVCMEEVRDVGDFISKSLK